MITTTEIKQQYLPTTPTTVFPFSIAYFEPSDINVSIVDVAGNTTILVLDTGFTVQAVNGNPEQGATITTSASYTTGETITIARIVPVTQEAEFLRGGDIPPELLNTGLDRVTAATQQVIDDSSRHISCPITDPDGLNYELPTVELRKNKVVGFDANGEAIAIDIGSGGGLVGVDTNKGLEVNGGIVAINLSDSTLKFDGASGVSVDTIQNANMATNSVNTDNLFGKSVTRQKIEEVTPQTVLGNMTGSAAVPFEVPVLDEDTMVSDSATVLATQQSIKAYVDKQVARIGNVVNGYYTDAVKYDEVGDYDDMRIVETDTAITLVDSTDRVRIDMSVSFNADGDLVFFIYRKIGAGAWTTIKSPVAGSRNNGLFTIYNNDITSTSDTVTFTYIDTPASTEVIQYAVGVNANNNRIAINSTFNDSDAVAHERLATSVILSEIPTP